jgi:hypothetical protein
MKSDFVIPKNNCLWIYKKLRVRGTPEFVKKCQEKWGGKIYYLKS